MNKILSVSALALVLAYSNLAFAGFKDNAPNVGGFNGPGISVASVAEAQKMKDDAAVVLEGKIEKSLGNEEYLFSDATGSIVVEIDDDDWKGITVTPQDLVLLKGEIEKDMFKTEIDVDVIELKK
jgi:uncharacterized protein (TIGR00156 family)